MAGLEAVLYALANKFLDDDELKKVREVLFMTRLGQMLFNDGVAEGIQKGERKVNQLISHLLNDNRQDDLKRSLIDPAYQKQLFEEYNL